MLQTLQFLLNGTANLSFLVFNSRDHYLQYQNTIKIHLCYAANLRYL